MSERCDLERKMAETRERILGLGIRGQRKSYYPQLQEHIMELERANRALSQSEEKYRTLIENVDVGIFRTSPGGEGRFIQANPALVRMLGYDSMENLFMQRPIDIYTHTKQRDIILMRLNRDGVIKNMKTVLNRRNGIPIHVMLTLKAHCSNDGCIEYVDGVVVDMTSQELSRRRIEQDRARLLAIFDSLPVGILMVGPVGEVLMANDRWLQTWGMNDPSEAAAMDKYIGHLAGSPERLRKEDCPITRAFRGESIFNKEIDVYRFDGSPGTLLMSAVPILDYSGRILGAVSTITDITARRELEREYDEARSRAEMYVDLLTHDISNYNAAAMGYLQLADMTLQLDEWDRRLIIRPLEELRTCTEMVANIWDMQRVEAGREKDRPVKIYPMLERVIQEHRDVPGRDVAITLHGGCECEVWATDLLSVVFSNILSNAIRHSGGTVNVDVWLDMIIRKDEKLVRIEIEDDGPGIPDERKSTVFDRSLRGLAKSVSRGLGLYLVKRLVGDFGGEVWVEDRVAGDHTQGARFVIELPALSQAMDVRAP